jgi:nitrogen fixation protein FixH
MVKQRPRGWWYPYIFVGGFLVVLAVNVVLMVFATSTFNGLETRHAWWEGNHYNAQIAAEDAQEALGWTVTFGSRSGPEAGPAADGLPARFDLDVHDRAGNPVDGLTVEAEVRRPTQEGYDRTVHLDPVGPGQYRTTVGLPLPGQWEVRLVASRGEDAYRLRERIVIR